MKEAWTILRKNMPTTFPSTTYSTVSLQSANNKQQSHNKLLKVVKKIK